MISIFLLVYFMIAIATPGTTQAITAQQVAMFRLPVHDDEYPHTITASVNNTTREPIFVTTRTFKDGIQTEIMVDPFSSQEFTVTIPDKDEITKTWILFSFNQESLRQFAESVNTGRRPKHIVDKEDGLIGIVTITRQKKFKPKSINITINDLNLDEEGAWQT